ncbi:MAG: pyridoxal-phosphate dependent enzyme [Armatimonadota bacterium]|nr:pyridoxal-phosphate dependent enzyme [Armatimonadota bacterium]MDR7559547.1 pyridoxal-phosphate dependent enzyme [Armatimonadota bacterium]
MTNVPGPTYAEMRDPRLLPDAFRRRVVEARAREEDPLNLFNITWRRPDGTINHAVLPADLTGVEANVIVLIGCHFPSGSHKVGPVYTTLMEAELEGRARPGVHTVVGPSTGNFGIGTAYVAQLKGYRAVVVMPDGMSRERYERIRRYGGELDLTPGTESDVILTLERTHAAYLHRPEFIVLEQFSLLPNYRFHRAVTGPAALEAAAAHGNGRVALFVAAPGSAGTLAAGDEIKARFPEALVAAPEPRECPTLYNNGIGSHRIEGVGDKMVTLIHNVLNTDYVLLVHDEDCLWSLLALQETPWGTLLGISGACNIIAAVRMAKYLGLGRGDNVVTVATDGFDRYPSVIADLKTRHPDWPQRLARWTEHPFQASTPEEILNVQPPEQKARLFAQKEATWVRLGYTEETLRRMRGRAFWEEEAGRVEEIDRRHLALRPPLA